MHDHPEADAAEKLDWAIARSRALGLRRTKALDALLRVLIEAKHPLSLADLAESDALRDRCDRATVYRLVTRLDEKGIIRRIGLHERSSYYVFLYPGEHHDYLICTDCGKIDPVGLDCPVAKLEEEVMRKSGYKQIYHELEFFGQCPDCNG
jgi:Fur family ferric uptake transcriptional regulator